MTRRDRFLIIVGVALVMLDLYLGSFGYTAGVAIISAVISMPVLVMSWQMRSRNSITDFFPIILGAILFLNGNTIIMVLYQRRIVTIEQFLIIEPLLFLAFVVTRLVGRKRA